MKSETGKEMLSGKRERTLKEKIKKKRRQEWKVQENERACLKKKSNGK